MDQLTLTLHKTKDTKNKVTAKLPRKHYGRGTAGRERPGRRAPQTGGRRAAVGAEGWVAPPVGSRGAPLGRPGAAGGRLSPSPCSEIQDGSGGRGCGPVHRPGGQALQAIMPEDTAVVDPARRVFELSASQIGRRIDAAAKAAGLGEGFTGHSGRVGMA